VCGHCDEDDPTESGYEYYVRVIRPIIDEFGWFIQYVHAEGTFASFAYTIGLTEHGCPELIATGVTPEEAAALLNTGGEVLHRRELRHGQRVAVAGRRVEVVDLPHPEAHLLFAGDVYGDRLTAVQLVCSDERGIWPWSREHRGGLGGQPVLGPRAVRLRAG